MKGITYNRIKAVLAERGKTNKVLADELDVTEETVSSWCVQKKQPSWKNLYAIADLLEIDVRELLVPNEKSPRRDFKF
jgi:putative transcriptional regulator